MQRRTLIQSSLAAAATLGVPRVFAQTWPSGPVKIIVGFPPGGGTDILARVVGAKLQAMWGQQVLVENKAGVAGVLAAQVRQTPQRRRVVLDGPRTPELTRTDARHDLPHM